MNIDAKKALWLSVMQAGPRVGFRRRLIDAMRALAAAPVGVVCIGNDDIRAYREGIRFVGDDARALSALEVARPFSLPQAFGFETRSVVESSRRVYLGSELFPPDSAATIPYFQDSGSSNQPHDALLVFLHEGSVLFGLAILERTRSEPAFDQLELAALEELAPFLVAGVRAQLLYEESSRESAALRVLAKVSGTMYVVDRDAKRVLWAANRVDGIDWRVDVVPIEDLVVNAAEAFLQSKANGDALPTPPQLPSGIVQGVARLEHEAVFGAPRCAVVQVAPLTREAPQAMASLSRREREIARLLVAGYSGVNVAAIVGLSENTVRTYVRRLYGKLGVANRADLVRQLMAPEPHSVAATSPASVSLGPPPDSSLLYGDDSLD